MVNRLGGMEFVNSQIKNFFLLVGAAVPMYDIFGIQDDTNKARIDIFEVTILIYQCPDFRSWKLFVLKRSMFLLCSCVCSLA